MLFVIRHTDSIHIHFQRFQSSLPVREIRFPDQHIAIVRYVLNLMAYLTLTFCCQTHHLTSWNLPRGSTSPSEWCTVVTMYMYVIFSYRCQSNAEKIQVQFEKAMKIKIFSDCQLSSFDLFHLNLKCSKFKIQFLWKNGQLGRKNLKTTRMAVNMLISDKP